MKFRLILGVVVVVALAAVGCTSSSGGDDSTTTTQAAVMTTTAPSTTTTQAPTTTVATTTVVAEPTEAATTDDVAWSDALVGTDVDMVFGSTAESISEVVDTAVVNGVEIVTISYLDQVEMADPRASGAMEYTSVVRIPLVDVPGATGDGYGGGYWHNEEVTLTNNGGSWVGWAMGVYTYQRNLPSDADATENPSGEAAGDIVVIGETHLVGQGGYDGLRLDYYSQTDGTMVGSIRPIE